MRFSTLFVVFIFFIATATSLQPPEENSDDVLQKPSSLKSGLSHTVSEVPPSKSDSPVGEPEKFEQEGQEFFSDQQQDKEEQEVQELGQEQQDKGEQEVQELGQGQQDKGEQEAQELGQEQQGLHKTTSEEKEQEAPELDKEEQEAQGLEEEQQVLQNEEEAQEAQKLDQENPDKEEQEIPDLDQKEPEDEPNKAPVPSKQESPAVNTSEKFPTFTNVGLDNTTLTVLEIGLGEPADEASFKESILSSLPPNFNSERIQVIFIHSQDLKKRTTVYIVRFSIRESTTGTSTGDVIQILNERIEGSEPIGNLNPFGQIQYVPSELVALPSSPEAAKVDIKEEAEEVAEGVAEEDVEEKAQEGAEENAQEDVEEPKQVVLGKDKLKLEPISLPVSSSGGSTGMLTAATVFMVVVTIVAVFFVKKSKKNRTSPVSDSFGSRDHDKHF